MAVIIRLQGLPVAAGSADIRHFFSGLNIPDGGVHIIGGEIGGAFIIFAMDEDARQAMSYSGRYIKGSRVELFLSSKTEMYNIIEINRKRVDHDGRETVFSSRHTGSNNSGGSGVGNLSNLVAAIKKGMDNSRYDSMGILQDKSNSNASRKSRKISKANYQPRTGSDTLYLFLRGMPYSATDEDIIHFFSGLQVEEVIIIKINGWSTGDGMVKFATPSDALEGLKRDRSYIGSRFVEINPSNEGLWIKYGGRMGKHMDNPLITEEFADNLSAEGFCSGRANLLSERHIRSRSPSRRIMARTYSRSQSRRITERSHSRSPPSRVATWTHSRSPLRKVTARSHSPFSDSGCGPSVSSYTFYIHVKHLSVNVKKNDLRSLFGESDIPDSNIIFLQSHNKRSKDAIVAFTSKKAYESAFSYHKQNVHHQPVHISPISKTSVLELTRTSGTTKSPERDYPGRDKYDQNEDSSSQTCVYVRNLPYDVTKVEVQKFFAGFNIDNRDISLLYDAKGVGLGEALVKFRSEDQARKAESLNRQRFLGTELLLRCISEEQMRELGSNVPPVANKMPHRERSELKYPVDFQEPSMQGNVKYPSDYIPSDDLKQSSDYRHLSDDSIYLPDRFRAPPTFGEGIRGNFPDGPFVSDSNLRDDSANITVIKLSNLPFQVSCNEILDFFHGYKIIPESLSIQQNEYAMFSGEALIAMVNYDEAVIAIKELNDRPIGQRKIRLNLV